ncbi:hypothetical protein R3P38DRAFT_3596214 [Favolaschia claudopus]|uniref:Uncharacterized protein n=1 Tax=Favolaschia claudopus TaxID=2862362 RepID=A0AAW0AEP1_9AGAR
MKDRKCVEGEESDETQSGAGAYLFSSPSFIPPVPCLPLRQPRNAHPEEVLITTVVCLRRTERRDAARDHCAAAGVVVGVVVVSCSTMVVDTSCKEEEGGEGKEGREEEDDTTLADALPLLASTPSTCTHTLHAYCLPPPRPLTPTPTPVCVVSWQAMLMGDGGGRRGADETQAGVRRRVGRGLAADDEEERMGMWMWMCSCTWGGCNMYGDLGLALALEEVALGSILLHERIVRRLRVASFLPRDLRWP